MAGSTKAGKIMSDKKIKTRPFKVHYGHHTLGRTDCGLVGDGGSWGAALLDFLATDGVTRIYRAHGLERMAG